MAGSDGAIIQTSAFIWVFFNFITNCCFGESGNDYATLQGCEIYL